MTARITNAERRTPEQEQGWIMSGHVRPEQHQKRSVSPSDNGPRIVNSHTQTAQRTSGGAQGAAGHSPPRFQPSQGEFGNFLISRGIFCRARSILGLGINLGLRRLFRCNFRPSPNFFNLFGPFFSIHRTLHGGVLSFFAANREPGTFRNLAGFCWAKNVMTATWVNEEPGLAGRSRSTSKGHFF